MLVSVSLVEVGFQVLRQAYLLYILCILCTLSQHVAAHVTDLELYWVQQ